MFCTKWQTSCFDVTDNTGKAGIYGKGQPEVDRHAFKLLPTIIDIRHPWILRSLLMEWEGWIGKYLM